MCIGSSYIAHFCWFSRNFFALSSGNEAVLGKRGQICFSIVLFFSPPSWVEGWICRINAADFRCSAAWTVDPVASVLLFFFVLWSVICGFRFVCGMCEGERENPRSLYRSTQTYPVYPGWTFSLSPPIWVNPSAPRQALHWSAFQTATLPLTLELPVEHWGRVDGAQKAPFMWAGQVG